MLTAIVETPTGSILISAIIGLGLASFFRKVCKDGRCVIIKGPNVNEMKDEVYKIDNECYTYTPVMTDCKK